MLKPVLLFLSSIVIPAITILMMYSAVFTKDKILPSIVNEGRKNVSLKVKGIFNPLYLTTQFRLTNNMNKNYIYTCGQPGWYMCKNFEGKEVS